MITKVKLNMTMTWTNELTTYRDRQHYYIPPTLTKSKLCSVLKNTRHICHINSQKNFSKKPVWKWPMPFSTRNLTICFDYENYLTQVKSLIYAASESKFPLSASFYTTNLTLYIRMKQESVCICNIIRGPRISPLKTRRPYTTTKTRSREQAASLP